MIKKIFGFIYKILSYVNLQPALFVAVIGAILFLTGVFKAVPVILLIFYIALIISFIYAIIATIKAIFTGGKTEKKEKKNKDKNKSVQIVEPTVNTTQDGGDTTSQVNNNALVDLDGEKPKYYRVQQNPNLIMAEYSNRYELFKIENQKLIKIRTDYK